MTVPMPGRAELWQTLRLLAACAAAYAAARLAGLQETYWALITAVVVTRPMLSDTLGKGRDRVLGSLIGGAVGLGVMLLVEHGWPKVPLFCAAFVPLALVVAIWPNLRLSAITLIVVVLVPGTSSPLVRPFDRVVEILIGSLAGTLVSALLRPDLLRRRAPSIAPEKEGEGAG